MRDFPKVGENFPPTSLSPIMACSTELSISMSTVPGWLGTYVEAVLDKAEVAWSPVEGLGPVMLDLLGAAPRLVFSGYQWSIRGLEVSRGAGQGGGPGPPPGRACRLFLPQLPTHPDM